MDEKPVVLVAFLEQDNLGIGYISSMLIEENMKVHIIDFNLGKQKILEKINQIDPLIVGFSIIFQYHIHEFKGLIDYLRTFGVDCHFCAGGHFPSLRYAELIEFIPELDSVVLFEGEHTFLELVKRIVAGKEWKKVKGIAYKENGSCLVNDLQPLEEDLDNFPIPVRQPLKEFALGKKYTTLLAGRGCVYNCSFCSIREFYAKPPGPLKRMRDPGKVVREMELLHDELGCSVFMFQDDDFPGGSRRGREWVAEFCDLLEQKGLNEQLMWKINCRADEIDLEMFARMKEAGLFLVYVGIEDGTDDGLKIMNKHLTAEDNLNAVVILNELGIKYDFGFMLFHPYSTFRSISQNLAFLEKICADGSAPVTFCKMLPYAETQIEGQLRKEGRIIGRPGFEDYTFLDPFLDRFYDFMKACFEDWMARRDGLLNTARWARFYTPVYRKYFPITSYFEELEEELTGCISQSNLVFIDTIKDLVGIFDRARSGEPALGILSQIKDDINIKHTHYIGQMLGVIEKLKNHALEKV